MIIQESNIFDTRRKVTNEEKAELLEYLKEHTETKFYKELKAY